MECEKRGEERKLFVCRISVQIPKSIKYDVKDKGKQIIRKIAG